MNNSWDNDDDNDMGVSYDKEERRSRAEGHM